MLIFNFYVPPEKGRNVARAFKRWISQEFPYVLSYLHMLNILMKIPTFSRSSA